MRPFRRRPVSNASCKHIHYLWAKGVVSGCTATTYCPSEVFARDAMAKFFANGFGCSFMDHRKPISRGPSGWMHPDPRSPRRGRSTAHPGRRVPGEHVYDRYSAVPLARVRWRRKLRRRMGELWSGRPEARRLRPAVRQHRRESRLGISDQHLHDLERVRPGSRRRPRRQLSRRWRSPGTSVGDSVFGRRFDASGVSAGPEPIPATPPTVRRLRPSPQTPRATSWLCGRAMARTVPATASSANVSPIPAHRLAPTSR